MNYGYTFGCLKKLVYDAKQRSYSKICWVEYVTKEFIQEFLLQRQPLAYFICNLIWITAEWGFMTHTG